MSRVLPVLFNIEMVRAILDGRKTVTRRCVKPKSRNACGFYVTFRKSDNAFMGVYDYDENERQFDNSQTPPCQPGDILYVRETWCKNPSSEEYYYAANRGKGVSAPYGLKWRPSIHMPKEAARIWLKVTNVRVERLQDIVNDEAALRREGVAASCLTLLNGSFASLWDSTIRKSDIDRYGWYANPWVWVITFERCEKPESEE